MKQNINEDQDRNERVISRHVESTHGKGISTKNSITGNTDTKLGSNSYANKFLESSGLQEKKTKHKKIHSSCGRKVNIFLLNDLDTLRLKATHQNLLLEIIVLDFVVLIAKVDAAQRKVNKIAQLMKFSHCFFFFLILIIDKVLIN